MYTGSLKNYIEAKNNDESNPYNKATFSTELCKKLLEIYENNDMKSNGVTVYDPFMGTGTTAVACESLGYDCYGSEISENQVKWAMDRLEKNKNRSKCLF